MKRDPILSQNQGFAVEIKKRKIEDAVERKYVESRAALRNQWCKKPDPHENIELERQLRKAATAGVVKLFNGESLDWAFFSTCILIGPLRHRQPLQCNSAVLEMFPFP